MVYSLILARTSSLSIVFYSYNVFGSLTTLTSSYSYLTAFKKKFIPEDFLIIGIFFLAFPIDFPFYTDKDLLKSAYFKSDDKSVANSCNFKLIAKYFVF